MADVTLTGFLSSTDGVVQSFLTQTYPGLANAVSEPIYYAAIIYTGVWGYKALNGHEAFNTKILIEKLALIILIFSALNWGGVANQIYGFFTSFSEGAAATILAGNSTSSVFDAFWNNINSAISQVMKKAEWDDFAIIIACIVTLFCNAGLMVVAMANMVLAKVGLAIIMLLLPLYLGFLLFGFTRQWFVNWMSMMLNFSLIYILSVLVIRFGFLVFADAIAEIQRTTGGLQTASVGIKQIISVVTMEGILIGFLFNVRGIAASLSGGAVVQGARAVEQFTSRGRSK